MADMTGSDDGVHQQEDEVAEGSAAIAEAAAAVRADPRDDAAWDRLEDAAAEAQAPDQVADLYLEVLGGDLSAELANDLGLRATNFLEEWYGEDSEALTKVLGRVLELDQACDWAFQRLTVAYTVTGRWEELLSLYDGAIAATEDPIARRSLLDEAVNVAKDFAQAPGRAIGYLRQSLELRPDDGRLVASLERLLQRQEQWEELAELWRSRLERMSADEAQDKRLQIALVQLDQLADPAAALEQLEAVLRAPGDRAAEVVELLERVAGWDGAGEGVRRRALDHLKDHYETQREPTEVVRVLEAVLVLADEAEQASLHREVGGRLIALERHAEALPHFAALLRLSPTAVDAHQRLRELAGRTGDSQAFVEALEAAAEACEHADTRVSLRLEAAKSRRLVLDDPQGAAALYGQVLEEEEAKSAAVLQACRQLNSLLETSGRTAEQLDVLERLAEQEPEASERRDVLGRAARLADSLDQTERALGLWRRRIDEEAADIEALGFTITILKREGRWEELVDVLLRRAEAPVSERQSREDMVLVARLRAEQLEDIDGAIATWQQVRERFGEDDESTNALADLYAEAGRWEEYSSLLDGAAERESLNIASILARLGEVCRDQLDAPDRAVDFYNRSLRINPGQAEAIAGMRQLLEDDEGRRGEVADILARAYESTSNWEQVLELLEHRLAMARTAAAQARLLRDTATLQEQQLEQEGVALQSICRALVLTPWDDSLEAEILRMGEATGLWSTVVEAFKDAGEAAFEAARRQHLRFEAGRLAEEHEGDFEVALSAYGAVHTESPTRLDAAVATVRTAGWCGRWERAAEALVAATAAAESLPDQLVEALEVAATEAEAWDEAAEAVDRAAAEAEGLKPPVARAIDQLVARWYEERLEDTAAATAALRRAAGREGNDEEVLRSLARLQWSDRGRDLFDTLISLADLRVIAGDLDPLASASRLALEALDDLDLQVASLSRLYRRSARLWRRGQEAAGEQKAEELARWSLDQLVALHFEHQQYAQTVNHLVDGAQLPLEPAEQTALLRQAAGVANDQMGDGQRAMVLYRSILADAPDDVETIRAFAQVCRDEGLDLELLSMLRRELKLCDEVERRLELRLEVARLIGKFENLGGRLEALRENLAEQPGHSSSIEALVAVHEDNERYLELADLLTEQAELLERQDQSEQAATLWQKIAALAERQLGDTQRAINAYRRVQKLIGSIESLDALARLQIERGDHAAAARWLERRLSLAEGAERLEIATDLASAHLAADQADQAIATLEAALAQAPETRSLRDKLADLLRQGRQWERLAALLTEAAPHVDDLDTLRAYAKEAAELFGRLGSPDRAITVLEKATTLAPGDRDLKRMLAEGLIAADRLDEGRAILEELIEGFGRRRNPERAAAHYLLARALEAQDDLDGALAELELASKMDVRNPRIAALLGRLALQAGQLERAERTYRALLMVVRRQAADEEIAIGAAEVLFELYKIAAERDREDQAQELLRSVLQTASSSAAEAKRFTAAMSERGEDELLLQALEMRVEAAGDGPELAEALGQLAELLADTPARRSEALEARLRALTHDAGRWDIHDETRALATELDQSERYADKLRGLVDTLRREEEAELASALLLRLGEVLEVDLEEFEGAAQTYRQAEALGVDVVRARIALARVAGARGEKDEEIRLLKALVDDDALAESARGDARYRLAELQLERPEATADGLATLDDALEFDAHYARAGEILRAATSEAPEDVDRLVLYGKVARASGDESMLIDFLEKRSRQLDATLGEAREAAELLERRGGEPERLEAMLRRAVEIAEASTEGLGAALWAPRGLAQMLGARGDLEQSASWLSRAAEASPDAEQAFELWIEGARLATDAADHGQALEIYERLLAERPADPRIWEPALDAATALGDEDKMVSLVHRTLGALDDGAARNTVRLRHAQFLLGLDGREPEAAAVLRQVIEEDPEHEAATQQLTELYERIGFDEDLSGLLQGQLETARESEDLEAIHDLSLRLGELLIKIRREDAIEVYRKALDWLPDDRDISASLLALLGPDDDPRERVDLMERPLRTEEGPSAADLAMRLADEWQALYDDEGVRRVLELGYQRYPADEALRQRLEEFYREHGDWQAVADLLVAEARRLEDWVESVKLLRAAAAIHRESLENPAGAIGCLATAREYAPDDIELLEELVAARREAGELETAAGEVREVIERLGEDSGSRVPLLLLRAELAEAMGAVDEAVTDLEAAYGEAGAEVAERLMEGLDQQRLSAAGAGDSERERAATLRLIAVRLENGQTEAARDTLDDWLASNPEDRDALYQRLELDAAEESWQAVAELCGNLVPLEEGEAQVEVVLRMVDAYEKLDEPAGAREGLEQVHEAQPGVESVRDRLWELYEKIGAKLQLATMLAAEAMANEDPEAKFKQLRKAGDLFLESDEGGQEQAIAPLETAVQIKPDDHQTTVLLIDAYIATGRYPEAGKLLEESIAAKGARRSPQLGELQHRMASLAAIAGDKQLQLQWLNVAFDSDRRNGEVVADLATVAMELGELDLALSALRVVTVSKVEGPLSRAQAFLMQAKIAHQRGESRRAMMWAHRAHEEDPDLVEASEFLEELGN